MTDSMSPERRKLIEQLLAKRGVPAEQPKARLGELSHIADDRKAELHRFYNALSNQLDTSAFGRSAYFLNLGYVPNASPQYSPIELPPRMIDRNSVKLVLETIGDFDPTGKKVLDVGCGRGGTIMVLTTYFSIASAVGLDLSATAVAFCQRQHGERNARFMVGDAENLPFATGSFDVLTNCESASCYPDIRAFYAEVHRVLRPGGAFLYTDCISPAENVAEYLGFFKQLGLELERNQDITNNVLASCDQLSDRRLEVVTPGGADAEMSSFMSAPGSATYEAMRNGKAKYVILRLRKH